MTRGLTQFVVWGVLLSGLGCAGDGEPQVLGRVDGMRLVPGGTFLMGTDRDEFAALQQLTGTDRTSIFEPEVPRHERTLPAFYLDATDVTNQAFAEFIAARPEWSLAAAATDDHNGRYLEHWGDNQAPAVEQREHPVTFVTWYAAASYCAWRDKRLPTEAEWEFSSGAGLDDRVFPWGDDLPTADVVNWSGSNINSTVPVASYPPNPLGLYDMSGNVWKFLADAWSDSHADHVAGGSPADEGVRAVTERSRTRRVVRGGSWGANVANLRVRYRDSHRPWDAREMVGFRCARDAR